MRPEKLRQEIEIELERMAATVAELESLRADVAARQPTVRERAAAGAFLSDLYGGVERVLLRVAQLHGVRVTAGPDWHARLLEMSTHGVRVGLPAALETGLAQELAAFRKFRHVFVHGYGVLLSWDDMLPGVSTARRVMSQFEAWARALITRAGSEDHA